MPNKNQILDNDAFNEDWGEMLLEDCAEYRYKEMIYVAVFACFVITLTLVLGLLDGSFDMGSMNDITVVFLISFVTTFYASSALYLYWYYLLKRTKYRVYEGGFGIIAPNGTVFIHKQQIKLLLQHDLMNIYEEMKVENVIPVIENSRYALEFYLYDKVSMPGLLYIPISRQKIFAGYFTTNKLYKELHQMLDE